MYHLPRVCRTLVPEIRVRPEILRVFRYIESKMTAELLFCDVHIDQAGTLNLLQCLRVIFGCRAVQTNSAETPLAL